MWCVQLLGMNVYVNKEMGKPNEDKRYFRHIFVIVIPFVFCQKETWVNDTRFSS